VPAKPSNPLVRYQIRLADKTSTHTTLVRDIVRRILNSGNTWGWGKTYRLLFEGIARANSRTSSNTSGSTPHNESCSTVSTKSTCSAATSIPQRAIRKRQATSAGADDDDSADDEDSRSPKRLRDNQPSIETRNERFACPFRKHDPQKYALHGPHTRCALAQLPTLSRVKFVSLGLSLHLAGLADQILREHLYRYHLAPIHCMRCWAQFRSNDELNDHLRVRAESLCSTRGGPKPEGITAAQERLLRIRKKSSRSQTEADRWMDMYKILFPEDPCPNSPCTVQSFLSQKRRSHC
jgi:hypothetical protein